MYQHILLAVALQNGEEFSLHALTARDVAVGLAKGVGAQLSVLSVYEYDNLDASSLPPEELGRYRETQMQRIDATMEQKMKALLEGVSSQGISVTPVLRVGEARQQILDTAESLAADVIVIGSHSKRGLLDMLLGGTAAYVYRHAPCPVVMVKPISTEKQ